MMSKSRIAEDAARLKYPESEVLDFKLTSYPDQKDWLKDVVAFANTSGGRLILGVGQDEHGRAKDAVGISGRVEVEIQRLTAWLAQSDPNVAHLVTFTPETADDGRNFIIVDVQESSTKPHRIELAGDDKFQRQVYVRKGTDNIPLKMAKIQEAVLEGAKAREQIDEFVADRRNEFNLEGAMKNDIVSGRNTSPHLFMAAHISPLRGFGSRKLVDWVLNNPDVRLAPDRVASSQTRANNEGASAGVAAREGDPVQIQLFNNGAAELVFPKIAAEWGEDDDEDRELVVPGEWLKRYLESHVAHVMMLMKRATGVDQFQIDVTFEGLHGFKLVWANGHGSSTVRLNEGFHLAPVIVRLDPDGRPSVDDLQQILDLVWRAWGLPRCPLTKEWR